MTANKKIESLQALRAIAFLGIFLDHAGAKYSWSELGVSVFYVLSGFLLVYSYNDKQIEASPKSNLLFSINKIKKLYMLHLFTMLCAIILSIVVILKKGITIGSIANLLIKIFLNITLMQTWYPNANVNVSLNGVAWFLSVMLFLYFMFPYMLSILKKIKKKMTLWLISVIALSLQVFACCLVINVFGLESKLYIWFMYCFPIFRLGDFIIGCCLGRIYLMKKRDISFSLCSVIEVVSIVLTVLLCWWTKQEHTMLIGKALNNWTTIYIPIAAIWVYLFTINKGIITKFLNKKSFRFLGDISPYTFLIHYVITQYFNTGISFIGLTMNFVMKFVLIIIEFILTIVLTILYLYATKCFKYRKGNRNSN